MLGHESGDQIGTKSMIDRIAIGLVGRVLTSAVSLERQLTKPVRRESHQLMEPILYEPARRLLQPAITTQPGNEES